MLAATIQMAREAAPPAAPEEATTESGRRREAYYCTDQGCWIAEQYFCNETGCWILSSSDQVELPEMVGKVVPSGASEKAVVQEGIFAPAVKLAAQAMGRKELNAFRASVIAEHTKVISAFVDTSESKFGQIALKRLFEAAYVIGAHHLRPHSLAHPLTPRTASSSQAAFRIPVRLSRRDKDGNGTLDKQEVKDALQAFGFKFVDEKEVNKIFKRADMDKDGAWQAARTRKSY